MIKDTMQIVKSYENFKYFVAKVFMSFVCLPASLGIWVLFEFESNTHGVSEKPQQTTAEISSRYFVSHKFKWEEGEKKFATFPWTNKVFLTDCIASSIFFHSFFVGSFIYKCALVSFFTFVREKTSCWNLKKKNCWKSNNAKQTREKHNNK